MSTARRSSLRDVPLSERVFATAMLVTLAIGFALSLVYLWAREIRPHREQGRRLLQSIIYTYHGTPERPRLLAVLHGTMASFVAPDELRAIDEWIAGGRMVRAYTIDDLRSLGHSGARPAACAAERAGGRVVSDPAEMT